MKPLCVIMRFCSVILLIEYLFVLFLESHEYFQCHVWKCGNLRSNKVICNWTVYFNYVNLFNNRKKLWDLLRKRMPQVCMHSIVLIVLNERINKWRKVFLISIFGMSLPLNVANVIRVARCVLSSSYRSL